MYACGHYSNTVRRQYHTVLLQYEYVEEYWRLRLYGTAAAQLLLLIYGVITSYVLNLSFYVLILLVNVHKSMKMLMMIMMMMIMMMITTIRKCVHDNKLFIWTARDLFLCH